MFVTNVFFSILDSRTEYGVTYLKNLFIGNSAVSIEIFIQEGIFLTSYGRAVADLVHAEEVVIIGTLQAVVPAEAVPGAAAGLLQGLGGVGAGGGTDGGQHGGDEQQPAITEHLWLTDHSLTFNDFLIFYFLCFMFTLYRSDYREVYKKNLVGVSNKSSFL